jgi:protein-histidine pros-kinase
MKLILKANVVLVLLFLFGLAVSYFGARRLLLENARLEIQSNARIMMESAMAVRSYTATQIEPLLATQMHAQFLPQSVPSYSATEYFNNLRTHFPEYAYKEATLNPTNPRDRAVDWEVDIVNNFRENATTQELMGERESATGRSLYLARPLRIVDPACLVCHSSVDAAPQTLIERYGNANGFDWRLQDVIGAQIVSVPFAVPVKHANALLSRFIDLQIGLFVILFVIVNVVLVIALERQNPQAEANAAA